MNVNDVSVVSDVSGETVASDVSGVEEDAEEMVASDISAVTELWELWAGSACVSGSDVSFWSGVVVPFDNNNAASATS
jgi:hypothetical protein